MAGSAAAKQALLSVGDVLLEVDGVQINSEDQLKEAVSKPNDRVSLKVGPNLKDKNNQLTNKLTVSIFIKLIFKIYGVAPNYTSMTNMYFLQCYMRALFDYDPKEDTLLPCKEIGLEFKRGDILQVSFSCLKLAFFFFRFLYILIALTVYAICALPKSNFNFLFQVSDRKDPNWWQASHVESPDVVGLIPSPELEERRKAYVPPEADFVHKISICGARVY